MGEDSTCKTKDERMRQLRRKRKEILRGEEVGKGEERVA